MPVKAAEEAVKLKDLVALERLGEATKGTADGREIQRLGEGLRGML